MLKQKILVSLILLLSCIVPAWALDLQKVEIRVPQKIALELEHFDEYRNISWIGVNRILYWSLTGQGSTASAFDLLTGTIIRVYHLDTESRNDIYRESIYRIDRSHGILIVQAGRRPLRIIPFARDPADTNAPSPVNLEYKYRGAMRGQSTIQIQQIQPDGRVVEGELYNDRQTMRDLGLVGDLGPGKILDILPDGRTVLLGTAHGNYIATIDNLRITSLSEILPISGISVNPMGSFFIDEKRIITTTSNFERGPIGGIDGPDVRYPVIIDTSGKIVAEFRSIEMPGIGQMSYDPVRRQIVIFELTDDRTAASEISVYRLVE